jgi:hypothetical protein
MNWFHNFSTRAKLFIGFGLVIVLLTVVIAAAISSVSSMEETRDEIFYDEFTNSAEMSTLKSGINGSGSRSSRWSGWRAGAKRTLSTRK